MDYRILALGDVASETGLQLLEKKLRTFKREQNIAFAVVNGENISGTGLTRPQAEALLAAGADVVTLGNHTFGKPQICRGSGRERPTSCGPPTSPAALRAAAAPLTTCGAFSVAVLVLIGRCESGLQRRQPLHHGGPPAEDAGQAHLHAGGVPRPGHQREAGHGLLSGWPRLRALGHAHPRAHRRQPRVPQGHRLRH